MKNLFYLLVLVLLGAMCTPEPPAEVSTFGLEVHPATVFEVMPGQHCVLLVEVVDETAGTGQGQAIALTADAAGATVTVEPASLTPGGVAEITVTPGEGPVGTLAVTVTGQRSGEQATADKDLTVVEGSIQDYEDSLSPTAVEMRDLFIPWLEANHPEFGITSQTEWDSMVVSPNILVVMHYLFFSDEWEMHVYWHVMIPPFNWAKIDLRNRFTEATYSQSFEISSITDPEQEPHAIELPEQVWR